MTWFRDAATDLLLGGRCAGCARPGRVLCPACELHLQPCAYLAWPTPTPPGLAPPWAAAEYAGVAQAVVLAHKEHSAFGLRQPLADLLAASIRAGAQGAGGELVLVPVPSRPGVVRQRGHDPTRSMVQAAAASLRRSGLAVNVAPVLRSRRGVADQAGLDSIERAANLAGSLSCAPAGGRRLAGRPGALVVCDDVLTTGATAREAQRALEAAGFSVTAIATAAATRKLTGLLPSGRSVG